MKAILDYFGHEIKTTNSEKGYFNAIIEIELSPTFYAWIFQFEGDIIIQSPQNAIDEFVKTAKIIIESHSKQRFKLQKIMRDNITVTKTKEQE